MTDKEKTEHITEVLYNKYAKIENTFAFKELCVQNEKCQWKRIDLYIIHTFPSKGFHSKSFEVKVSRADFKNDFKKENKQDMAIKYSNEFYYVTPPSLIKLDEIPEYAGLIEVDSNSKCKIIKKAPKREKDNCDWYFSIMMLKNKTKQEMEQQRILNFDNNERNMLQLNIKNKEKDLKRNEQFISYLLNTTKKLCELVGVDNLPDEYRPFLNYIDLNK